MADPNRPNVPSPYDSLPAPASFDLTSTDLTDGEQMPADRVDTSAGGCSR